MKKIGKSHLIIVLAILVGTSSCLGLICINGNGVFASEERPETGFSGISNSTSANVHFSKSDNYSIIIEADQNLLQYISTSVSSGVLEIDIEGTRCIRPERTPLIYITGPEISEIYSSGSGDIFADMLIGDDIKIVDSGSGNIISNSALASDVEIINTGSGDISIQELISDEARIKISGSGDVSAEGNIETLNITSTGSGNFNGQDLFSTLCNSLISGSGNVYIYVTQELIATLTGSGNLYYQGNPDIYQNITGTGRIVNANK